MKSSRSRRWLLRSSRSGLHAVERGSGTRLRAALRTRGAKPSFARSLLLLLLLMVGVSLCNSGTAAASPPSTDETTTTTTEPPSTSSSTTLPPPSTNAPVSPDYESFEVCSTPTLVSLSEWSECSTAYNVDKLRQTVTVGMFLLVGLLLTLVLLTFMRR